MALTGMGAARRIRQSEVLCDEFFAKSIVSRERKGSMNARRNP